MNTIQLTAENFIRALQGEEVVDQNGNEQCFLDSTGNAVMLYEDPYERFVVVDEDIIINSSKQFHKHIEIDNVQCKNVTINAATFHSDLHIFGGIFKDFKIVDANLLDFSTFGGNFSSLYVGGNTTVEREYRITKIECSQITIEGGTIQMHSSISHCKVGTITIKGGVFNGLVGQSLTISENEIDRDITIGGGTFDSGVDISEIKNLKIEGGEFKKDVRVQSSNSDSSCVIEEGSFRNELQILGPELGALTINHRAFKIKLEGVSIRKCAFINEIDYSLNIYKCFIDRLFFGNIISSKGKVSIDNSKVDSLVFDQFVNEGHFRINDLIPKTSGSSEIQFVKSVLGNMILSGLSFSSYCKIIIDSCQLQSIDISLEPFPISDKVYTDIQGSQDALKLSEIYRQLYYIAKNQGDRINEITYYAEYMASYQKHLRQNGKGTAAIATLFTLWFSKYSTRYGTNWLQGVGITIVLSLLFFVLYCLLFPKVEVDIAHFSYKNLSFYAVKYIEFLNPVHKFDFMNGGLPSFGSAVIDLITRVLVGALIYQIIVAFRRLGKF